MGRVRLEIMPGLSHHFNADHLGRLVLEKEVGDGATVGDLLEEIASQNREVRKALFNAGTGKLAVHICLILNGSFLELSGGLEAGLRSGDTIRLMLAFSGG